MKHIVLFGAWFIFAASLIVLRHFSIQRNRQNELELRQRKAAAERAQQREEYR